LRAVRGREAKGFIAPPITFLLPGPVALGARKVEDDLLGLGVDFALDGALGVEDLVGNVGHDGGAARGDAAFGDENEEAREILVDGEGGVKFGGLREKVGREVFEVAGRGDEGEASDELHFEVAGTQAGFGGDAASAAASAILVDMQAARVVRYCGDRAGAGDRRGPSQRWLRVNGSRIDD
jgi:hypothetical protein